ncbi:MAG TPA: hypothetical protein VFQ39_11700 [Longimicrobium sp.]|nr:hypothetical protein [Longimicrobium sp.]
MPRPTPAPTRTASTTTAPDESSLRFSPRGLVLLAAGMVAIVAGYWLLGAGDNVAAPLLLVLGYAVLVPLGLIL